MSKTNTQQVQNRPVWEWGDGSALFLAYVVVLVVLLAVKAKTSLRLDEAYSVLIARRSLAELIISLEADTWPPLYFVALSFWIRLFGDSELGARSLSLVVFVLCLGATYKLAFDIFGNSRIALFSAWLLSVMSLAVNHATNARGYMMLCLASAISTRFALAAMYRKGRELPFAVGYIAASFAGLMTHYSFGYVMLAHLVLCFSHFRDRLALLVVTQGIASGVFVVSWGTIFWHQLTEIAPLGLVWIKPTSLLTLMDALAAPFGSVTGSSRYAVFTGLCWAILLAPLIATIRPMARRIDDSAVHLILLVFAELVALLVVSRFKPSYVPGRQDVIIVPLIAILFARWLCATISSRTIMLVLVSLSLLRIGATSYQAFKGDTGTDRWVARQICAVASSGDVVILTDLSWCGITYYLGRICPQKTVELVAFPSDIPSHPGWRNLNHIAQQIAAGSDLEALIQRLNTAGSKGARALIVAMSPFPVYQEVRQRLNAHFTLLNRWAVPNHAKTGTYVSELLYYSFTPTTPTSQPRRESHR
ncbi:MAG: glycosyltransferase family 39 protein [Firmicutes bacterium]|nr:glycosyltransferase family 39 protein [Bacillota bacterium]